MIKAGEALLHTQGGRRDGNYFLPGPECFLNRREDNLNRPENNLDSGEHYLLEREDILERLDNFPGCSEDNLNGCDHFLHLPNKYRQDWENDLRDSEMFLRRSETFLSLSETFLSQ